MDDIRKSLKAILYERSKSPFYGAFILSWIIWNWELLYFFFGYNGDFYEKTIYIHGKYLKWDYNLFYPLLSAIIYYPLGFLISIGFQYIKVNLLNFQKSKVDKWELLSVEQSYKLKNEMEQREMKIERELVDLNEKLKDSENRNTQSLKDSSTNLEKISLLEKEKNDYEKEVVSLKNKNLIYIESNEKLTKELEEQKKIKNDKLRQKFNKVLSTVKNEIIKDDEIYYEDPQKKKDVMTYSSAFLDYEEGTFNVWALVSAEHNNPKNGKRYSYIVSHDTNKGKSIARNGYQYENAWALSRYVNPNELNGGEWRFWCSNNDGVTNTILKTNEGLNEGWHMFTVKWSKPKDFLEFYIDGKIKSVGKFILWPVKNDGKLYVGNWPNLNESHKFNSKIGRLYTTNQVLNQEELDLLYNKGKKALEIV